MKLMEMDVERAAEILSLRIVKHSGVTHFLNNEALEVTVADADKSIAESQADLEAAAQSSLAGGTQYWHWKNISAWTVLKPHLSAEKV